MILVGLHGTALCVCMAHTRVCAHVCEGVHTGKHFLDELKTFTLIPLSTQSKLDSCLPAVGLASWTGLGSCCHLGNKTSSDKQLHFYN